MNQTTLKRHAVRISGAGPKTIVFAPGFGCDQTMWRLVAPAFEKQFRVVLFDYVGSGKSDYQAYSSETYSTLEGYAQDIVAIIEALGDGKVIFIGHSAGGTIGMLASILAPERFERLIMLGPSSCYVNAPPDYAGGFEREELEALIGMMDLNYIGWAKYLSQAVMQNADRPSLAGELEESFCSTDPLVAREFAQAVFFSDYRDRLQHVKVPSLILQCAEDIIAPESAGAHMHEGIAGSTFMKMAATGHCPHMSHPEETIRLIFNYLEKEGMLDG
ncbi:sigma factor SigB regulation protein RsbQ [Sporosarcina sp. NCCP-2716]|uniref:alpha/beta fold hydrolase n=1 Tax=Sporosarcina sp. NCCP-2716 TaxID=2943679 RepID=UPI0020421267|nr:alpha/beta hydrolase [Sporosarcina sp. NCCP-2716]GKV70309.1 sigma factor SigB regulation protein RsbQ [Sporosarcina sp. NCCP-2716]